MQEAHPADVQEEFLLESDVSLCVLRQSSVENLNSFFNSHLIDQKLDLVFNILLFENDDQSLSWSVLVLVLTVQDNLCVVTQRVEAAVSVSEFCTFVWLVQLVFSNLLQKGAICFVDQN